MNTIASFPSSNITTIIARVVYPIQCSMQNDDEKLKNSFYKLLKVTSFIIFPLMLGLAALAHPLVYVLLSAKWLEAAPLLTIICFALMWNHIMFLNWQLLAVKGRSDLSFKSEIYKKVISIIILFVTIPLGIKAMCIGLVCYSLFDMIIIIYFLRPILSIKYKDEFRLLMPIFLLAVSMFGIIQISINYIPNYYIKLAVGIIIGSLYYISMACLLKIEALQYILNKLKKQL